MQIGDLLGDKQSSSFASEIANKLTQPFWLHEQEGTSLQAIFVSLNSNLKALVFQHLRQNSNIACIVAESWPADMQQVCF